MGTSVRTFTAAPFISFHCFASNSSCEECLRVSSFNSDRYLHHKTLWQFEVFSFRNTSFSIPNIPFNLKPSRRARRSLTHRPAGRSSPPRRLLSSGEDHLLDGSSLTSKDPVTAAKAKARPIGTVDVDGRVPVVARWGGRVGGGPREFVGKRWLETFEGERGLRFM